jgi:hypothetical protein
MPRRTRTSQFHANPDRRVALSYTLVYTHSDNHKYFITCLVYEDKVEKHLIGSHWPDMQGHRHTAVVPADQDDVNKMYMTFAQHFVQSFTGDGMREQWFELEYEDKEIPGGGMFAANVGAHTFSRVVKVLVGASVCRKGDEIFVLINHGPYPVR